MGWIKLNATDPAPPAGAQNVHFRQDAAHLGTEADPLPVSAYLSPFTGDSGAGGASGLVPAPAAGDAAAGKVLKADGTWYVPSSGLSNPMTAAGDLIVGGASGAPARLAAGASGQVLTANGEGVAPSWQAASGGGADGWTGSVPSSPTSSGTAGQYSSDGTHAYLCYATNLWGRFPMSPLFENPPVTDGLVLYFDANMYGFTDGASVASITDLSGNGYNAVAQSGGAVFHTSQINGRAALQFAGVSTGRYVLSNGFFAPDSTVFCVAKAAASAGNSILGGVTKSYFLSLQPNGSGVSPQLATQYTATIGTSTTVITADTFAQFNATLSSAGTWAFRVAQADAGSGSFSGTMPSVPSSTLGWENAAVPYDFNGEIAEVIVYNRVLTSVEIAAVESWLNGKYGV